MSQSVDELETELLEIGLRPGGLHVHPLGKDDGYLATIGFLASRHFLEPITNKSGYRYWRTTLMGRDAIWKRALKK